MPQSRPTARLRQLLCRLCLLLPGSPALAQMQFVDPADVAVPLAAGAVTTIGFSLRNTGSVPVVVQFGVSPYTSPINVYGLQATGPCTVPAGFPFPQPGFATIGAGAEVTCSYTLQRQANAFSDTVLVFALEQQPGPQPPRKQFLVGDLARVQVTQAVERLPQPGLPGRVRITVGNQGPSAIAALRYEVCGMVAFPSQVVNVVGGDCLQLGPGSCGGGLTETGFRFEGLAVGSARHCIVELAPPGTQSLFPLFLAIAKPGGATLVNTNPATDQLVIRGIQPVPQQVPAAAGSALLGLLLALAAAGLGLRRR